MDYTLTPNSNIDTFPPFKLMVLHMQYREPKSEGMRENVVKLFGSKKQFNGVKYVFCVERDCIFGLVW